MAEAEGGAIRQLLAVFGFGVDTKELEKGENQLDKFFEKIERIAGAVTAAFAVREVYEFGNAQAELLDHLDDTANALGISTERVQQLQFASRSLGDDADRLLNLIGRLQVSQQAAAQGSKEQAQAFSQMGVKLHDTNGKMKAADELFLDVADGIAKQKDASKQAALATQLFGRAGREILPFLKEGRKGFEELAEGYKELGGGYTQEAIEKGAEFQKQQARLNLVVSNFKNTILVRLFPILSKLVEYLTKATHWVIEMTKNSYLLQSALIVLGSAAAAFGVMMAIANAPLLLITAGIAALILFIDDFITLMEGGQSVIGEVIDKIFGKDAHLDTIKEIKEVWSGVKDVFSELWREIKLIWDAFKWWKDNLGAIGDALGDTAAKVRNYFVETAPAKGVKRFTGAKGEKAIDYGRGGLSFAQNQSGLNAQAVLEAAARGEDISKVPLSLGKGETRAQELEFVKKWIPSILAGQFPQFTPRAEGPLPSPVVINQQITAAEGMDEKKLGEHAAKAVHEVLKQDRRAAAATLPRKAAK